MVKSLLTVDRLVQLDSADTLKGTLRVWMKHEGLWQLMDIWWVGDANELEIHMVNTAQQVFC